MVLDTEAIFKWLYNKDYIKIITFLKENGNKQIADDVILGRALESFFNELINSSENVKDKIIVFNHLFVLHTKGYYPFTEDQFKIIVLALVSESGNLQEASYYAKFLPDLPECRSVIEKFERNEPQHVEHEVNNSIEVKSLAGQVEGGFLKSIFNSYQEKLFFHALRNSFPYYLILPNVSLTTIIKSTVAKQVFDDADLRFFFSSTVDFVIVDQFDDFKPLIAIELDSEWHRINNQESKDRNKNRILMQAGISLFRIEDHRKAKSIDDFEKIIRETIKLSK